MRILIVGVIGAAALFYLAIKFFPIKATYIYILWGIGLGVYLLFLLSGWFVLLLIDVILLVAFAFFTKVTTG
ncbi:MAG: hypothetical protein DRP50_01485 [Thermotoga sp.]|nr:MAG: hypothetical protein DRP50_01485 [Thermotoga sp.]